MVFPCIVCTILFNVYFGKFVMTFIDIGEMGCMSIPKCHWMVIVVNFVQANLIFCMMLVWFFMYAGSVSGIPASSCDSRR